MCTPANRNEDILKQTESGNVQEERNKLSHCRFCAKQMKCKQLLDLTIDNETMQLYLLILQFFKIDFIQFSDPNIPKTTCESCYNMFNKCYSFFLTAKESQIILKHLYTKIKDEYGVKCLANDNSTDIKTDVNDYKGDPLITNLNTNTEVPIISRRNSIDTTCFDQPHSAIHDSDNKYEVYQIKDEEEDSNLLANYNSDTDVESGSNDYKNETQISINTDEADKSRQSSVVSNCYNQLHDLDEEESIIEDSDDNLGNRRNTSNSTEILQNSVNFDDPLYCDVHLLKKDYDELAKDDNEVQTENTETGDRDKEYNENQNENIDNDDDGSWDTYVWICKHCQVEFYNMEDLRWHSLQVHQKCYAFACGDCSRHDLNMFNTFVEHVREHRERLRYFCPYCNAHFESIDDCSNHTLTHWSKGQRACEWCGEIFPDADTLRLHMSMSKRDRVSVKVKNIGKNNLKYKRETTTSTRKDNESLAIDPLGPSITWEDYEWSCQECTQVFPDVKSLRTHTQKLHDKCFSMKCADCLKVCANYRTFVRHVCRHRPHLKIFCPYCNTHIEDSNELQKHIDNHYTSPQRPCDGCGHIFKNKLSETEHYRQFDPQRQAKYLSEEDLTCELCETVFKSIGQLKTHSKMHDENRNEENICNTCGKQFSTKYYLASHLAIHKDRTKDKTHTCKICSKSFYTKRSLKVHVYIHLEKNKFICDYCSKGFHWKHSLRAHITYHHMRKHDKNKLICEFCGKKFISTSNLNVHRNIHIGARPFQCQNCDKTFTNWANCNKHMMRIHKTTLAKTKLTEHGRIPISRIEEVKNTIKNITADKKQWMQNILKNKHVMT